MTKTLGYVAAFLLFIRIFCSLPPKTLRVTQELVRMGASISKIIFQPIVRQSVEAMVHLPAVIQKHNIIYRQDLCGNETLRLAASANLAHLDHPDRRGWELDWVFLHIAKGIQEIGES